MVIGDSMADWLAYGLEENFADTPEIGVVRKIRPTSGLVRYDPKSDTLDWSQAVKDILATEKPSAIVVMLGLNDRLPLKDRAAPHPGSKLPADDAGQSSSPPAEAAPQDAEQPAIAGNERPGPGGMYEFHTDKWADLYAKRVDDMIAALKTKGVPVVWVGLPAIRGPKSTGDMSYLDEVYRARADKAGIVYVDIWDGFVDEQGRYAAQGPDFEGQIRRLRTGDGVHFTKAGAVKMASYVERELRRVMSSHLAPMAMPAPEETPKANGPGPRPVVGPVLPLTTATSGDGGDLLGAASRATPATADPIAARVLTHGDPIAAPAGRSDDFSWPRPGVDANAAPDLTPEPGVPTPPASSKGAAKSDAKKPADAKVDAKSKTAPDAPNTRLRRSPNAGLDGGVPRPPAPIGAANSATTAR